MPFHVHDHQETNSLVLGYLVHKLSCFCNKFIAIVIKIMRVIVIDHILGIIRIKSEVQNNRRINASFVIFHYIITLGFF